ncbi:MAG TPA: glucosamine-6-phosphate deaminase [Clostridia bacterium]|nr:glucosamine-6-phosphate deaminase [Clostridia bacterium]
MHLIVCPDRNAQAKACAAILASQVLQKPACVLGLATGSTPIPIYRELVALYREGVLDFSKVQTFNLDEYVGLGPDHPQSYNRFMWDYLFSAVGMRPEQVRLPNGMAADLHAECSQYEREIAEAGGIDVQLLGIGHDGHIAFNEPGDAFELDMHVAVLTEDTIKANRRFFDREEDVPRTALSLGVGSIMRARQIVLSAFGKEKAAIIREAFRGPITPKVPASILQFHTNCTVVLDKEAAAEL